MKKSVLTLALLASWAAAGEAPRKSPLRIWFEHLKKGLSESAVSDRRQKGRVTAVAAVRGSAQDSLDPDKPQWKGGRSKKKRLELKKERAEFAAAVDLILEGRNAEGLAALEAFEKSYPQSSLLPDVSEARAKAMELAAEPATKDP